MADACSSQVPTLRGCATQSTCVHTTAKTDNRPITGKQSTESKFRDRVTKHSSSPFTKSLQPVPKITFEDIDNILDKKLKTPNKIKERGYQFFAEGYIHNFEGRYWFCSSTFDKMIESTCN